MLYFFVFIVAMFITMVLTPPLMTAARRFALLDLPDERKVHAQPMPRIGGLAMAVGYVIPVLLWCSMSQLTLSLLAGIAVIIVFGVLDDRYALDYRAKFIGQFIAVFIVMFFGGVRINYVPFHGIEAISPGISIPLTVFALLGVTNAINLADGLDGLAGGTTLLSYALIGLLAYSAQDYQLVLLVLAMAGCITGFLRFNTHPAQVFMGDGGSQFLGFTLGVLVITLTQRSDPALSPAMPLLLLGLPLLDTFMVMSQRLYERRSPFSPDKNHIHHKLLALGFDHYEAVIFIYLLQTALVVMANAFRYESDLLNMALFSGIFIGTVVLLRVLMFAGWRAHRHHPTELATPIARAAQWLETPGLLGRYYVWFVAATLPLFLVATTVFTSNFPRDGVYTVLALLSISSFALLGQRQVNYVTFIDRLIGYAAITVIVYYQVTTRDASPSFQMFENLYYLLLLLALVFTFRFARPGVFNVTPLDILVLVVALLVPNVLGPILPVARAGELILKLFVLFYASELLLAQRRIRAQTLRNSVTALLALLMVVVILHGPDVS